MIIHDFLNQKPMEILDDFLSNYSGVFKIDKAKAKKIILDCLKYYKTNKNIPKYLKDLEYRWYSSLDGDIDYSVYNDQYYFATDLFPCFVLYSRNYIININRNAITKQALKNSNSIIDLGCGIGYSTAMLKQMFPKKRIIGTNLALTDQYIFCNEIKEKYDFELVGTEIDLTCNVDMVFASEYFEHIQDASDNVMSLIKHIKPKYLLLANTFSQRSVGHFNFYKYKDNQLNMFEKHIPNKKISRLFNKTIFDLGYKKLETGLWNNRPNFWSRNETNTII